MNYAEALRFEESADQRAGRMSQAEAEAAQVLRVRSQAILGTKENARIETANRVLRKELSKTIFRIIAHRDNLEAKAK